MAPRKAAAPTPTPPSPPPVSTLREPARPEIRAVANHPVNPAHPGIGHNSHGRVIAYSRSGQPVSRASAASGVDQFYVPPGIKPDGWSWEWKRVTVANEPDPGYAAELAQVGWEPVLAESYPGVFMPQDYKGAIMRRGLMLMERDERLTEEARREEKRRADERVGSAIAKHSLNTQGAHGVSLDAHGARANTYVRKSVEVVDVPPPRYERPGGAQSVD